MKRSVSLGTAILVGCFLSALASAATSQGVWRGEMNCAKLSFTKGPQKVRVVVTIKGSQAFFSRQVWNEDRSAVVGTEEGMGEITQDGEIKLTGRWKSSAADARYTYSAVYSGRLVSGRGRLDGEQIWQFDGKMEKRSCSIGLAK